MYVFKNIFINNHKKMLFTEIKNFISKAIIGNWK